MPERFRFIVGVDEAGRGPLAGPVVAAAVILPDNASIPGLDDSKRLTPEQRNKLFDIIGSVAISIGIGLASPEEIDAINILEATKLAAERAIIQLNPQPEFILTDALKLNDTGIPVLPIIKGDQKCRAIAAASVVAKVYRDRLMLAYHQEYPQYGFSSHKGYPTREHLRALERYGPSTIHRLSFNGVCWFDQKLVYSASFLRLKEKIKNSLRNKTGLSSIKKELNLLRDFLPKREINEFSQYIKKLKFDEGYRS